MKLLRVDPAPLGSDLALLIARMGIGLLMLTHGLPKLSMMLADGPIEFPPVMGMSPALSLGLTIFSEVICSLFVITGLGTRLASGLLAITMAVAAFLIHLHDPFSTQEMSLHFLLVYIVLLLTGSGRYSLDYLIQQRASS